MRTIIVSLALAILATTNAKATTYFEESFTCPIGGEKFKAMQIGSHTSWGQQPDGMPIGSLNGPTPIVECPKNGLVLFENFDKQTIERLKPLIADPEFQALRKSETQYYRLWWLLNKLGKNERDLAWVMITASWEAGKDQHKRTRYQTQYVRMITAIQRKDPSDWDWVYLQGRAANAMRELGQFEAAKALVGKLPLSELPMIVPKLILGKKRKYLSQQNSNQEEIDAADTRNSWVTYFEKLSVLIDNKVISARPVTMVPDDYAAMGCVDDRAGQTAFEKQYCEKPDIKKLSVAYEQARARWEKEEAAEAAKSVTIK